jgi:hypothetical protein
MENQNVPQKIVFKNGTSCDVKRVFK